MPLKVRLTLEPDGATCLESPYDREFVDGLKAALDWGGRSWDATRKRWLVSALYADDLAQYLASAGCEIQDDRTPAAMVGAPAALPAMPTELREAFDVLYLQYTAPLCVAVGSYKALARYVHPDKGGNAAEFQRINDAMDIIRHYLDPQEDDVPF